MTVDLRTVRFVAPDRYQVLFDTGAGQQSIGCRIEVRAGAEQVVPEAGWPDGVDATRVEAAVLALARLRGPVEPAGGALITDAAHPANRAIDAARRGDLDRLRALIDWPLSVLPPLSAGMAGLEDEARTWAISMALAEFDAAPTDTTAGAKPLRGLAGRLAAATELRAATPEARRTALLGLRPPETPVSLPGAERARLRELAARAEQVREVVVASTADRAIPLAVAPDTGLLVVLAG